jgi:hypothetical protein
MSRVDRKVGVIVGVVLIVAILAVVFYFNSTNSSTNSSYDLTESFGIHGQVTGSGSFSGELTGEILRDFDDAYDENSEKGLETYFVFMKDDRVVLASYEDLFKGGVNIVLGGTSHTVDINDKEFTSIKAPRRGDSEDTQKAEFIIDGESYEFDIDPLENKYFIISKG